MFPVIVRLDNRAGLLKPGMNAAVEVLVNERSETLAVPNNAIVQPQELGPAAEVLGLGPESMSIEFRAWGPLMAQAGARFAEMEGGSAQPATGAAADVRAMLRSGEITRDSARSLWASMRRRGGGGTAPSGAGMREEDAPAGEAVGDGTGGGGDLRAEASAEGGEGGRDGTRGAGRGGAGWGGVGGSAGDPARGFRGGAMAPMGGSTGDRAYRPAVAFVVDTAGGITPRPVVIGLSDWDYVEILAGLEAGEELALIGAAQLQARQQERLERMRRRMRPF